MLRFKTVIVAMLVAAVLFLMVCLQRGLFIRVNTMDVIHPFAQDRIGPNSMRTMTISPILEVVDNQSLPKKPLQRTMKGEIVGAAPPVQKNPIPDSDTLKNMSDADIVNFYHSFVMSPRVTCNNVKRMGSVKDGGWEMCDDALYKPDPNNCLVYSFGINNDFTYDDDMAEYGCEIHSFDPSMEAKDHLRGRRVHFHATGVYGHNGHIENDWQVYTVGTYRKMLGHNVTQRRLDIVKMDIEGSELSTLATVLKEGSLDDVRQLSWETHLKLEGSPARNDYISYLNVMRDLHEAGFRIYLTSRNHVWSSFHSQVIGKQRVTCHEINMVNIKNLRSDKSKS